MELRQLRYFSEVVRTGSYTAAAASLSVAQPALWRQVKDLESELGMPLFERIGRRVRLTRAGETLRDQANGVLAAAQRLRETAEDLRAGRTGTVSIACAAPHLREFLAPVIARLRSEHPGVRVEVREYGGGPGPGPGIKVDLLDGTVDLATGLGEIEPGLEGLPLYDVGLLVAVGDGHPWRNWAQVEVEALRDQPLVVAQVGSYSRGRLEIACLRAGFSPTIGFESPNPLSILALGQAGLGLPILVEDAVPSPDRPWPVLAEGGRPITSPMLLAWRSRAAMTPAVSAFIELAAREIEVRRSNGGLA